VSKKGKTHLDDVSMFALGCPILLVGVGARDMVCDVNGSKKGIEFLIFPTPIRLNNNYFLVKPTLNELLKF
jgi:hypothetical protein